MAEDSIYKFEGLKRLLRSKGYQVDEAKPYETKKGVDIGLEEFRSGRVKFDELGGIKYVDDDGIEHLGFLYMRNYDLDSWGLPRMHTVRCKTLDSFVQQGTFAKKYRFAETREVMVYDTSSDRDLEVDNLPHCKNCRDAIINMNFRGLSGSAEFERLVETSVKYQKYRDARAPKNVDVDIFGFSKDWNDIKTKKLEDSNYTCERCGLHISDPFDQQYIQVHHKNGRREDNKPYNLQCLCLRCHAMIDSKHRVSIVEGTAGILYRDFIAKYSK